MILILWGWTFLHSKLIITDFFYNDFEFQTIIITGEKKGENIYETIHEYTVQDKIMGMQIS